MNSEYKDKTIGYENMDADRVSNDESPSYPYQIGHLAERLKQIIGKEAVRAFAQRADVSEGTVRNLLNGGVPKLDSLAKIAEAAGVTIEWLSTGIGSKHYISEQKQTYLIDNKKKELTNEDLEKRKKVIEVIAKNTHDPDQVWSALIVELMHDHGLDESGVKRILETLATIKALCK